METPSNPNPQPEPQPKPKNKKRRALIILIVLLLSITGIGLYIISCEKEDFEPGKDQQHEPKEKEPKDHHKPKTKEDSMMTPQGTNVRAGNLLYEETCEETALFPTAHNIEKNSSAWTLSYIKSPVFQGLQSARFELRKDMELVGSAQRHRVEVVVIKGDEYPNFPKDVWYSFAVLFPAKGMESDTYRDAINQWFEDGSDETTLRVERDRAFLEVTPPVGITKLIKYDLFGTGSTNSTSGLDAFTPLPKDKWFEFIFHFIHSTDSDGLIEVWRDGAKIHTIKGRNMHLKLPKWKIGLYKSSMASSPIYSRVIYFDNIKVGNSSSTFETMTSGAAQTTPPTTAPPQAAVTPPAAPTAPPQTPTAPAAPAGQLVTSFTLINAETDKPIKTIAEGEAISLTAIKTQKINIQANVSGTVGSIVFNLTGAQSKSRTDGKIPFAALGDDGTGNFYSWIPTLGKYTLKAIPYQTTNGSGAAGSATVLNFSVVK